MKDEDIMNDISVMRKDFDNRINIMQAIVDSKDGERDAMRLEYENKLHLEVTKLKDYELS